jgi:hypothetical protein
VKSIAVAFCLGILFLPGNLRAETAPIPVPEPAAEPAMTASGPRATVFLPARDLFQPLLADPKEPRFYISYLVLKFHSDKNQSAVGGYGEIFGLYRSGDGAAGYGWQANFSGGVHAQFDLDSPTFDLVNTDYTIGFPFSIRKGAASYRIAVYHQSSHLGDEFLLKNNIERVEFSYEALQLLGSYEWTSWRVYYGGEYIIHQGPTDLEPAALQTGVEYYGTKSVIGRGRFVGGLDLKSDQTHAWALNSSGKAGLQFDSSEANGRFIRLLAVGYNGFVPYGQFYHNSVSFAGIEVSFKF